MWFLHKGNSALPGFDKVYENKKLHTYLPSECVYDQNEQTIKFKYTWMSFYPFPSCSINYIHQFAAMWYSNYICVCRLSWTKQSRDTLIFDHLFWYTHDIKWNCLEHIPFYVFTLKIWMKRKVELTYVLYIYRKCLEDYTDSIQDLTNILWDKNRDIMAILKPIFGM